MAATLSSASASASFASTVDARRAWRRSIAATVCRLFLTRWWISRIVASLPMRARSRRRRSVTSWRNTMAPVRTPSRTRGMPRSRTTAVAFSTSARPADATGRHGRQRLVHGSVAVGEAHGELRERRADDVGGQPETAQRAHGVGAGVGHGALRIEPHDAVADARGLGRVGAGLGDGEAPVDDHGEQVVRRGQVDLLELAGHARCPGRMPGDDADHLLAPPHGVRLHPARHPRVLDVAQGDRAAERRGLVELRVPAARRVGADEVVRDDRGRRRRPHLGDGHEPALVPGGHPQDEVAQREIGEQRPLLHDSGEQVDVLEAEVGPLLDDAGEGGHEPRGYAGPPRKAGTATSSAAGRWARSAPGPWPAAPRST